MRRKPFARVNSCGFACTPEASAKARKAARAGTIATNAKIQLLFYSGSFTDSFFSPMLELSSKTARGEVSWATRLRSGLGKTRSRLSGLFTDRTVDPALFEEIETALLASDAGAEATRFLLAPLERTLDLSGKKPRIVMLAGVNGSGKTTSIGKLARYFQDQGRSVLLAAGDTFRAAAREQLAAWGEKNSVAVVAQSGGDPGAVVFDAIAAARSRHPLPLRFVGIGEGIDDLRPFAADEFVSALLD